MLNWQNQTLDCGRVTCANKAKRNIVTCVQVQRGHEMEGLQSWQTECSQKWPTEERWRKQEIKSRWQVCCLKQDKNSLSYQLLGGNPEQDVLRRQKCWFLTKKVI